MNTTMTPSQTVERVSSFTEDDLAEFLGRFAAVGTSEIHLIPTSSDLDQLRRAADVVADFTAGFNEGVRS